MDRILERKTAISVRREGKEIISETLWLDSMREYVGVIRVKIDSLEISDAWIDVLKKPSERTEAMPAFAPQTRIRCDFPSGTRAFIDGRKAAGIFRFLPEGWMMKYLMEQCINGVIQAETYFYRERGFKDKEEYNQYWDRLEENGCRMYSHPAAEDLRWMDYVPQIQRQQYLFHRLKSAEIFRNGGSIVCKGTLTDSYHEIAMKLVCAGNCGTIQQAEIMYYRAPGKACFDNRKLAQYLLGKNLYVMNSMEAVGIVGRSEGCYHLVELLKDILMTIKEWKAWKK